MKSTAKLVLTFLLLAALATALAAFRPAQASLQGPGNDRFVFGGTYTLQSGETLEGSLFILGAAATLEPESLVTGDVMIMGGTLTVQGKVEGDVNAVGGLVTLGSTALVQGDVNIAAGNLVRDDNAVVEGKVNNAALYGPFSIIVPGKIEVPNLGHVPSVELPGNVTVPRVGWAGFNPLGDVLWWLGRSFIWAVVALLLVMFAPVGVRRAGKAAISRPLPSGGMGCLTTLVAPVLLIILVITICGIPLALVGAFIFWAAWLFGIVALGLEVGERMAQAVHRDWAPAVSAALGTFALTLVVNGIGAVVPCIGWIVPALAGLVALGAALLTRFGVQSYPPETGLAPEPPAPPSLPAEPPAPVEVVDAPSIEPAPPTAFMDLPEAAPEMPAEQEGGDEAEAA